MTDRAHDPHPTAVTVAATAAVTATSSPDSRNRVDIARLRQGDRRSIARALTIVERQGETAGQLLADILPHTTDSWLLGVTGAPGTGKSTLVDQFITVLRQQGERVAVLAIDPSSPFSGGALLGDRVRMQSHFMDDGVFIRSMAARGNLGGLAPTTRDCARVLAAAGYDWVIVETVGAGQNEIDVMRLVDTTIVVEAPGLGDGVQAIKAGILEIADILVVNKGDRAGARQTVRALKAMLEMAASSQTSATQHSGHHTTTAQTRIDEPSALHDAEADAHPDDAGPDAVWRVPVLTTVATDGSGIADVLDSVRQHRQLLTTTDGLQVQRRRQLERELRSHLQQVLLDSFMARLDDARWRDLLQRVASGQQTIQHAIRVLLADETD